MVISSCSSVLSKSCYKGVFRTIALGSTHGLSTHSCTFVLSFGPLIVPVGRIALGRILNVLGSSIDKKLGTVFSLLSWEFSVFISMITHTNLFADASNWIFYLAYLFSHTIELECSNFKQQCVRTMSLLAFQEASEYRFYHTDTLFALVKPIHKTPLPMISLTISVNLFETGIKVVDLLTPYKCGGKIDLFFSAGVGKTVLIMEFI